MDTYRHLREHGNSAFIFLLELGLAALVYSLIAKSDKSAPEQLGVIAVFLAIWAVPAVFVHLIGQHLERRFSHYDRRLQRDLAPPGSSAATTQEPASRGGNEGRDGG
jgi:hypothetical protein